MPAIRLFGSADDRAAVGTTKLIRDMSAGEIRGGVRVLHRRRRGSPAAGIIALARSLPTIVGRSRRIRRYARQPLGQAVAAKRRTDDVCRSASPRVRPTPARHRDFCADPCVA